MLPLTRDKGSVGLRDLDSLLGKCERVAFVVPAAKPFVNAWWAALLAGRQAQHQPRPEAPPRRAAVRRFTSAARWMHALVQGSVRAPLPLQRRVPAEGPEPARPDSGMAIASDASPWGGGAVLLANGVPQKFFAVTWTRRDVERATRSDPRGPSYAIGEPSGQSYWEFLTIALALVQASAAQF